MFLHKLIFFFLLTTSLSFSKTIFEKLEVKIHKYKFKNAIVIEKRFKNDEIKMLSHEIKLGPNFADFFRIPDIRCGLNCITVAIIDCKTGRIYDDDVMDLTSNKSGDKVKVEFNRSSKLLLLEGCLGTKNKKCGTHYFKWENYKFSPIAS